MFSLFCHKKNEIFFLMGLSGQSYKDLASFKNKIFGKTFFGLSEENGRGWEGRGSWVIEICLTTNKQHQVLLCLI